MTTDPVDTDLACAAADLQHAIHLVGVADRCGDDPARADVLAEARTLIHSAAQRMVPPAASDPEPEPGVVAITARDLRIGDRLHAHDGPWVVLGIKRYHDDNDVEVMFGVEDETLVGVHHTRTWSDTWRVHALTPRPGGEEYALAEAPS